MRTMRRIGWAGVVGMALLLPAAVWGQAATRPARGTDKLPHIQVDLDARQVRVECEAIDLEAPLEFLCVTRGGNEHEALLRTDAKPSHIHLALLMLGQQPGTPLKYLEAAKQWVPPSGPPLNISLEFERDGKTQLIPATRALKAVQRDGETVKTHAINNWVFTGSQVQDGGAYAADITGYVVSLVNFELTPIDVGQLASSSNEELEWQRNPAVAPAPGSKVTMILQPIGGGKTGAAATQPAAAPPSAAPGQPSPAEVRLDQAKVDRLRKQWTDAVGRGAGPLRKAAEEHYEIIRQLQAEQQRLISEADRVARVIDELQKDYNDLITPHPAAAQPAN